MAGSAWGPNLQLMIVVVQGWDPALSTAATAVFRRRRIIPGEKTEAGASYSFFGAAPRTVYMFGALTRPKEKRASFGTHKTVTDSFV